MKSNTGMNRLVDDYIDRFPDEVQLRLREIRRIIFDAAPGVAESISYGMPAYKLFGKPLVYFAACKSHIGFYVTPSGHEEFARELKKYKHGKGSVQFPNDQPIPFDLIGQMVEFRVEENREVVDRMEEAVSQRAIR